MLDLVVVGGGIVGLATAHRFLRRFPGRAVRVLEKEASPGGHQSGHNSGVLHSGLYYAPGSLKARNCVAGKAALEAFCREAGVPFERCGKLVVATREAELPRLAELERRAAANGVETRRLRREEIRAVEPEAGGLAALHVPGTGIVDYRRVVGALVEAVRDAGGEVRCGAEVRRATAAEGGVLVEVGGEREPLRAARAVLCGGLQSDRLARRSGLDPALRVVPFLGEYRALRPAFRERIRGLVYPVPDPALPFLGVHLTRRVDGGVDCGPNALLAPAREGYRKAAVDPRDLLESLAWPGTWRLGLRYARTGAAELWRSLSTAAFARDLARLCPALEADWLEPAPAGVRAQALARDGTLVDDFTVLEDGPLLHLVNAPSPAATSCLAIAGHLVDRLASPPAHAG
jgi:L-2-hydroxyglutarate oxidase